ncbi:MAG: hypothetical protein OEX04_14900 [Acidimicrobiia bacterium]|nr:hypothetical protein [Acidimicrobiia bacterium]MDH4308754.1 hypothetical protein [Acidimicrobiia bacterium]
MRIRIAVLLSFLVVIGMSVPATAAPYNSPPWGEPQILDVDFDFPNPCLGEDEMDLWYFHGPIYAREFQTPAGNTHFQSIWWIAVSTAAGFSMPERMIGVDVVNEGTNTFHYTGTGLYQLRNEEGQQLRAQIKIQVTVVDGEIVHEKVDGWDFACIGKG